MNQNDISRAFTEKVTELLGRSYQIYPGTMGGSQGGGLTLACAALGSSALTAVVNAIVSAVQKKRGKATTQEAHLAEIDKKLGKMQEHQNEQYLAILRLTIMSEEMPMAERLIAGEKYKKMGGNGDVKKFLHQLEAQCGHSNGV